MSRYGDNIRRISKTKELEDLLRDAQQRIKILDKAAINGKRGVAYNTEDGSYLLSQNGGVGNTSPNKLGDNGSLYGNNPNGGLDDNSVTGDSLLANTPNVGEDIGAIQLKDCDTDEPIDVRFNTAGNVGEAIFKHPENWGVNGESPSESSYLAGSVWTLFSGVTGYFSNSFGGLLTAFMNASGWAYVYTIEAGVVSSLTPSAGDALIQFTNTVRTIGQAPIGGVQYVYTSGPSVGAGQYGRVVCGTYAGDTTACDAAAPVYSSWQAQDPTVRHQLAFNSANGGFFSSQYDSGIPSNFANPISNSDYTVIGNKPGLSKLQLCTDTDVPVVVEALKNGEIVFFEDDGFGAPDITTYPIKKFDKDGKYVGTITPDEYTSQTI